MNISRIAAAVAISVSATSSFAANLGTLDLSTGSGAFSNTPIAGSFVDTLTFILGASSTINGSVGTVLNGNQDVDLTSIMITGPTNVSFTQRLFDPAPEIWALPDAGTLLSPGTYTLTLTGVNSPGVATYAGTLAVTVLPEPQTYAMLLAGLGAVGFLARRRFS